MMTLFISQDMYQYSLQNIYNFTLTASHLNKSFLKKRKQAVPFQNNHQRKMKNLSAYLKKLDKKERLEFVNEQQCLH